MTKVEPGQLRSLAGPVTTAKGCRLDLPPGAIVLVCRRLVGHWWECRVDAYNVTIIHEDDLADYK